MRTTSKPKAQAAAQMDWRKEPEMPRKEEIMTRQPPSLPAHQVDVPPGDRDRYLETQYRLLRYEGTEPLRRAVHEFREDPGIEESAQMAVYANVAVHGYWVTPVGTLCRIGFCPRANKRIRWKHSTRLTSGTIVALSTKEDNFKSICKIASVVEKELVRGLEPDLDAGEHPDTPPRINIAWADPQDAVLDPGVGLIMIEARNGYYESVRHAMRGLQIWSQCTSQFERYLIDGKPDGHAPKYMEELNHTLDLTSIAATNTAGSSPGPSLCTVDMKSECSPAVASLTGLDSSQLNALRHAFESELAIIQGPPGTGKTFTSISALRVLLSNIDSHKHPIVIAAQTNHALDQILLLLFQATGSEFVRLGLRSKNETIASRTVHHIRKRAQSNFGGAEVGRLEAQRKAHTAEMKDLIGACFPEDFLEPGELLASGLITQHQYDSLVSGSEDEEEPKNPFGAWLDNAVEPCPPHRFTPPASDQWEEVEDPDTHGGQAIAIDEYGKEPLSGTFIPIVERLNGRVDARMMGLVLMKRVQAMLRRHQDLWSVQREYRGAVYRFLRKQYVEMRTSNLKTLLEESVQITKDKRACQATSNARLIQKMRIPIIGCTTTGLTKYRKLIENLKPRVMLIEEAAETREANITSALFPSLEQLILVGDHMQLAPQTALPELSCDPHNLCLSLFERMINLKMGHAVLEVQRRMIPEIRRILKPFYPTLRDHASVLDKTMRPPVPGMGDVSSYFFCHRWPESRTVQQSRVNTEEARMIVGFVRYLVQNGTPTTNITVLTFYQGQRRHILDQLSRDVVLANLNPQRRYNVCTVDGYQGEENDVVILSLVRSPRGDNPYNVGFLDNQNRVVVSLSRARRGLYIFGNYNNLVESGSKARKIWKRPLDVLKKTDRTGRCHSKLPLECQNHGSVVEVRRPQDWVSLHGGCRETCTEQLGCGHMCKLLCHPSSHDRLECKQPCNRKLPCGHGCSEVCSDNCRCGEECKYAMKNTKRTNANFVTLDEFLGSGEQCHDALPATAVKDAVPDLISIWDDEIIPNEAVASDASGSNVSPDFVSQDPSEVGSEKSRHSSRTGTETTTPDSANISPIIAEFPSILPGEILSLSGNENHNSGSTGGGDRAPQTWSKWNPEGEKLEMSRDADIGDGAREGDQVFNETFKEVRVKRGCQREPVQVHHRKVVQAPRQAEKVPSSDSRIASPESVPEPVTPPSHPDEILIDFDAPMHPAAVPTGPGASALAVSKELVCSVGDEDLLLLEDRVEALVLEDGASEFGVLIEF